MMPFRYLIPKCSFAEGLGLQMCHKHRVQMKNLLGELEPDSDTNKGLEETVQWNVHPFSLSCALSLLESQKIFCKHFSFIFPSKFQWFTPNSSPPQNKNLVGTHKVIVIRLKACLIRIVTEEKRSENFHPSFFVGLDYK